MSRHHCEADIIAFVGGRIHGELPMREKSSADRCRKLNQLVECQGYDSVDDLLATVISDSVSLAICLNEGCDYPVLSGF